MIRLSPFRLLCGVGVFSIFSVGFPAVGLALVGLLFPIFVRAPARANSS